MEKVDMKRVLSLLQEYLIFPESLIKTYEKQIKEKKITTIIPIQEIAAFNKIKLNFQYNDEIEDIESNEIALKEWWDFLFAEDLPRGKVLFYPSFGGLNGVSGIISDSTQLKKILFKNYKSIFDEYPQPTMGDFYFVFLDTLQFIGFEHPGVKYCFKICKLSQ